MNAIMLTGGTGFVGRHLRPALGASPVIVLGRKRPVLLDNEQWSYMDMAEPVASEELEQGEILCHLAYAMAEGRENVTYNQHLLDAVNTCPSIRQVVLMSSVSVYGEHNSLMVNEESPCNPLGEYAETKLVCESLWMEKLRENCALTILRPAEIFGPGGRGMLPLIRDALHRPLVGALKRSLFYHRPLHYVAVSNVAAAIRFCLLHNPGSRCEIYVVSDDHQPENGSYAAMQDTVRRAAGRQPLRGVAIHRSGLVILGKVSGRPLGVKTTFSSGRIHDAGFRDAVTLREEIERLVESLEG